MFSSRVQAGSVTGRSIVELKLGYLIPGILRHSYLLGGRVAFSMHFRMCLALRQPGVIPKSARCGPIEWAFPMSVYRAAHSGRS